MKRLKEIVNALKISAENQHQDAEKLIREFIFYSPKMPLRLHQEQLLAEAKRFSLPVFDTYFTAKALTINCFSWGTGAVKVLLTHGWASKAADFYELITALRNIDDLEIIAFDAPGNGSSVSEFSNLMLYADSVKAIAADYAKPDFYVGHSLGGMANVIAIQEAGLKPKQLISIAPLIRLKENFEQSMQSVNIGVEAQANFFHNFSKEFPVKADHFNLSSLYHLNPAIQHFLAYDVEDHISPYAYLNTFLEQNPQIKAKAYPDAGHYKILKSPEVIEDVVALIKSAL
ncbi:alpha/beta hydrolase [Pedobacter aquatilis]|uniref:alpha/beta fold hydrolase n=1 Tax=Pedobacter aquatilis TaxID=351343 RepID=UPI00292E1D5C|nr:alpha/beta hydrolase [Pedobacter aquatilis]